MNDMAEGFIPASRLAVPKSEIFNTPLNMLSSTLAPLMSRWTILLSCCQTVSVTTISTLDVTDITVDKLVIMLSNSISNNH